MHWLNRFDLTLTHKIINKKKRIFWSHKNTLQTASHLVELQQQDQAGPAGVIQGQQEDAKHPGRTADQGGDRAPQALLLVMQRTVSRPV